MATFSSRPIATWVHCFTPHHLPAPTNTTTTHSRRGSSPIRMATYSMKTWAERPIDTSGIFFPFDMHPLCPILIYSEWTFRCLNIIVIAVRVWWAVSVIPINIWTHSITRLSKTFLKTILSIGTLSCMKSIRQKYTIPIFNIRNRSATDLYLNFANNLKKSQTL